MEAVSSQDLAMLWHRYKNENDLQAREDLILNYVSLVKYHAGRMGIGFRGYLEQDDLISAGVFGLINAVDRFDPEKGVKFETYALARIKGSILDWLRSLNWIPQSLRAKAQKLENVMVDLEQKLGRPAEEQEIADYLGLSLTDLHRLMQEVAPVVLVSFEDNWLTPSGGEGLSLVELVPDSEAVDPVKSLEFKELKQILAEAISRLPEKERLVITLYYYEGLILKEIGQTLGVSESRVSQLHTKAILRLRGSLSRKKKGLIA